MSLKGKEKAARECRVALLPPCFLSPCRRPKTRATQRRDRQLRTRSQVQFRFVSGHSPTLSKIVRRLSQSNGPSTARDREKGILCTKDMSRLRSDKAQIAQVIISFVFCLPFNVHKFSERDKGGSTTSCKCLVASRE